MKLENKTAGELLGKNKEKAQKAAKKIINTPDIDAWQCLLENSEYIFSYIKDRAGKNLAAQINKDNVDKVIELMKVHEDDWDEYIAKGLSKISDDALNEKMFKILKEGFVEEKTYAAKYFCFIKYPVASQALFEASNSYYLQLKSNAAEALGVLQHEESYLHNIEKLKSEDEWDRIEAAQFLAKYGRKDATIAILKAMETSGMAELLAGEIATLTDMHELFEEQEEKTRLLALEAMDNILSGIPEIWPLGVVFDFKIFECLEKLLNLAKEPRQNNLTGRYAQILLKAKQKITMFVTNSQYTFDEEKDILSELDEIYHLLIYENEKFWDSQFQLLLKELELSSKKRKLAAINVLNELQDEESVPHLMKIVLKQDEDEVVISEVITTLARMGHTRDIDETMLLSRIKDPNLLAVVKNSLAQGTSINPGL